MAAQLSEATLAPEVFLTVVVDSSTPAWDELFAKYLRTIIGTVLLAPNGPKLPKQSRISYILYSSATPDASPIVKDMYFTRSQEIQNAIKTIQGPLQGPIARNLPGGGSASLEALVRAVEHIDLMEELEPHSAASPKHIFFVTSSPPDDSQRPLWNHCEKFDHFGWKQCEEWLHKRSVALTLMTTRLPPHPVYTSLYAALNPGAGEPIPPKGPVRVFISRALWPRMRPTPNQNPNQVGSQSVSLSHSSPAFPTNSPAATASSPSANRKRKSEDTQESPRRNKFPAGTVGNRPVTPTPPSSIVMTPALAPNGSPVRPASVTAMRSTMGMGVGQVKTEGQSTVALSASSQAHNIVQPGNGSSTSTVINQSQPSTSSQPGSQGSFPSQVPAYHVVNQNNTGVSQTGQGVQPISGSSAGATTAGNQPGPASTTGLPSSNPQIDAFLSSSIENQRERLTKLKDMLEEHKQSITQLQAANRYQEAKERLTSHDKIRDFIMVLMQAQQVRARQTGQQASMLGTPGSGAGMTATPQNSINLTTGQSRQPFQPNNSNGANESIHGGMNMNIGANPGNPFTSQLIPPGVPQNPPAQPTQYLWRGSLSITGQDGLRATPELLVFLSTIKATLYQQEALSAWPTKIFMTPIRQHTPPDRLVSWLGSNKPEGLFNVRAIGLDHWASSQQTPSNTVAITNGIRNFDMAQKAIVTNKLVLHGTVELKTGGQVTLMLIHTPTGNNMAGASDPQIAIARYTIPPNLNTLPGNPMPNTGNVGSAPPPGAWGHSSATPASQSSSMPSSNINTQSAFNNGGMVGNNLGGNAMVGTKDLSSNIGSNTAGPPSMASSNPTGAAAGGNQQLLNFLLNLGGPNLVNSLGGANNLDIAALTKNPQVMAHLLRFRQQQQQQQALQQHQQQQQQQMGLAMAGNGGMGNSGMGTSGMNAGNLANLGLSGASLLDRLSTQPLGRSAMPGTVAAGNNAFGPAATSTLARQQFLQTLSAHSSAVGALAANNNNSQPTANNAALFNQFNSLNYGLGGGINMSASSTGAHNPNTGSNGMPMGGTMLGNNGAPGSREELVRRANVLASQRGISQQDALKALVSYTMGMQSQQSWNGAPQGGGG